MTTNEITFHEVSESADRIFSEGEMPTIVKVQNALNKGSLNDIAKHLVLWGNLKTANPGVLDGTNNTPPAASLAVQDVLTHAHDGKSSSHAHHSIFDTVMHAREPEKSHSAMAELVKENQILADKIISLTKENDKLREKVKILTDGKS
jgi:hypothetical protein